MFKFLIDTIINFDLIYDDSAIVKWICNANKKNPRKNFILLIILYVL